MNHTEPSLKEGPTGNRAPGLSLEGCLRIPSAAAYLGGDTPRNAYFGPDCTDVVRKNMVADLDIRIARSVFEHRARRSLARVWMHGVDLPIYGCSTILDVSEGALHPLPFHPRGRVNLWATILTFGIFPYFMQRPGQAISVSLLGSGPRREGTYYIGRRDVVSTLLLLPTLNLLDRACSPSGVQQGALVEERARRILADLEAALDGR